MAVVVLIFGMVIAFSVPAIQSHTTTNNLKGATENIVAQFRVARQIAISTGANQAIFFDAGVQNSDYRIQNNDVVGGKWSLPRGVNYYWGEGTVNNYTFSTNGRVTPSGMVILEDTRGIRDTVSVQASGLVGVR